MLISAPTPQPLLDPGSSSPMNRKQETRGCVLDQRKSEQDRVEGNGNQRAQRSVRINRGQGLHLRVCSAIVTAAQSVSVGDTPTRVTLRKSDQVADATSILDLMSLGADQGEHVELCAAGPQAATIVDSLVRLLSSHET